MLTLRGGAVIAALVQSGSLNKGLGPGVGRRVKLRRVEIIHMDQFHDLRVLGEQSVGFCIVKYARRPRGFDKQAVGVAGDDVIACSLSQLGV